ncbi:HAD-like domain-containing protein [Mycena galopus ATCC 62051]|nr:HAD-like domain-containing protein [Mycena galopus ATCC 62051]
MAYVLWARGASPRDVETHRPSSPMSSDLRNVQALLFDVFGTTVDWHGSLTEDLATLGKKYGIDGDWSAFSKTWRRGYIEHVQDISRGGTGVLNMDELHRGILEKTLESPEWNHFGAVLDQEEREKLNNAWHRLRGWPDVTAGLYALKKELIVGSLSNGNPRLLIDVAKFADLPWDFVFSSEFFGSFKPDLKVYQGAIKYLSLEPEKCAMVAAHAWDLRGAAAAGMKTIYVRRAAEEPIGQEEVKPKSEGGEVDLMSMTAQESEDLKAFKARTHAKIKAELEPAVQSAKQELLNKMKQVHNDKPKQAQFLQEYNDAIWAIDQAGTERFKDEVLQEKIRRSGDRDGGWSDLSTSADRAQSRIGNFVPVGEFGESPDWPSFGGQRGTHGRKSSLGHNASLLTSSKPSSPMYGRSPPTGTRPSHPYSGEDTLLQSTAKVTGVDEARIRKFAEEQARLERVHSPVTPITDPAIRKFAEEQARLHRAHSPEVPRNDTHLKFAEEQARLHRAHSPELSRSNGTDSKSKFAEEQARLNRAHSPDISRSEARSRASHTPSSSTSTAADARLAAFAEQQLRAQNQFAESRNGSSSRLGQNQTPQTQTQTQTGRGKQSAPVPTPSPAPYVPTMRRGAGAKAAAQAQAQAQAQSMFGRFPLNERDETTSAYKSYDSNLTAVEVLFFDLDGTVLNWQGTVAAELRRLGNKHFPEIHDKVDWEGFALKWRDLYLAAIRGLAEHGDSLAPSSVYRTTLDQLLSKESKQLASRWTPTVRNQLVEVWDRSQAWPDTKDGLQAMKRIKTIATLSNLPLRTQTQMSRHAGLTWDVCLSSSLLGCFKPTTEAYVEAARSMTLPISKCALVSAHVEELRIAEGAGMKTIYVRRASEDRERSTMTGEAEDVLSKLEGGDIDIVVDSFEHLAIVLGCDD